MAGMAEIEKGIPVPAPHCGRPRKYPWRDIEVGESFFIPCDKESRNRVQCSMLGMCRRSRANGKRFTTRSVVEQGKSGIRVWRIE